MSKMLDAALNYARMGIRVLPLHTTTIDGVCSCRRGKECPSAGKHPHTKHGYKDATCDEEKVRQFWQSAPNANIGIATGKGFGIVIDVDPRNGGNETLEEFIKTHGPLPETATSLTGGGGKHYIFQYLEGLSLPKTLGKGIDIQSDGKLIVAPPSRHASGRHYMWERDLGGALAPLPSAVLEFQTDKTDKTGDFGELGRNNTLTKLAGKMVYEGARFSEILATITLKNQTFSPPLGEGELNDIAKGILRYAKEQKTWLRPEPLPDPTPAVPKLAYELLPKRLAPWILDVCERMQVPLEFVAAPMLTAISGAIGRRAVIFPKQEDTWKEPPNLWGALISPPGTLKSPSLAAAIAPLQALEIEKRTEFSAAMAKFSSFEAVLKCQIEALKKKSKKGDTAEDSIRLAEEIEKLELEVQTKRPKLSRHIVNDSTAEKLLEILRDNPQGVLMFRDELTGLFMGLEKAGRESERAFLLEAWSGNGSYTSDRVSRGTIGADHICLSVLGSIQHDRLRRYFDDIFSGNSGDDGLLARFQILVWPEIQKEFTLIDRKPNAAAQQVFLEIFSRIQNISVADSKESKEFRFSADAQLIFNAWLTTLEARLRSNEIESNAFRAHLSKYRSLMPSLALIFEIIEAGQSVEAKTVSAESTRMAVDWCAFLEQHAAKVYAPAIQPNIYAAHSIASRIRDGSIRCGMPIREIYRKGWSGLKSPEQVRSGLEVLENLHWVEIKENKTGLTGASSEVVHINPNVTAKY